jgi:hypothetical protein
MAIEVVHQQTSETFSGKFAKFEKGKFSSIQDHAG